MTRRLVSLIVAHPDGSVSSTAFHASQAQFDALTDQLTMDSGGPAYCRHIPAGDIADWAPRLGRVGVVVQAAET